MTSDWQDRWRERRGSFADECETALNGFLQDLKHPRVAQARVFEDILAISRQSRHWTQSGYDRMSPDLTTFRRTLPIMRYEDFVPILEQEALIKGGVLTCSPVLRWLKTSGTTGTPKQVPYTLHWLSHYRVPAQKVMWGTYIRHYPAIIDNPYATLDTQTVRENVSDYVYGLKHQAISNRHPQVGSFDWDPPWYDAPWFGPNPPPGHDARTYFRLRYLLGRDLRYISAINPSTLLSLHHSLFLHRERLLRDLADGTLDGTRIDSGNPSESKRLATVLVDPAFSLKDVWASLSLYSCWMSASARLYQGKLDAIFPGVAKLPFMTCGTEGVVTLPVNDSIDSQPLAINQAIFEFLPADDSLEDYLVKGRTPPTLLSEELEVGKDYHLIMTQANGLYRLATGDIFRVNYMIGGVPWIQFLRRDGVFYSFTGEKLTETQVTEAISDALNEVGIPMGLYMCGPRWGETPSYVVMVETDRRCDPQSLATSIDSRLKHINIEYAAKRDSGRLGALDVIIVPKDTISTYVESKRTQKNANQYKYKPFHQDISFVEDIRQSSKSHAIPLNAELQEV